MVLIFPLFQKAQNWIWKRNAVEISDAISNMKGGKATGADGLQIDIYKTFKVKLLSPLLDMYAESSQQGCFPPS